MNARKGRPLPGINNTKWWEKKWIIEFIAAFIALGLLIFTGSKQLNENTNNLVTWIAFGFLAFFTVGIGFLRTAQSYAADQKEKKSSEHDGLLGTLIAIHAIALEIINKNRDEEDYADLRVTFHRVAPDPRKPTHLEQVTPYVTNDGIIGKAGREFSVNVGITGHAVRMQEPFVLSSSAQNNDEHIDTLVEEWAYLRWQAEALTPNRFSAVAAPVLADMTQRWRPGITKKHVAQVVIGVVYLDSDKPDAFDAEEVQEQLFALFDVVADYVTWRY